MADPHEGREFRGGLILGGDAAARGPEPVEIADYDPLWPTRFEQMRELLAEALADTALRIDHVGSTAVPGLPAKPVVDIQVSVSDVDDETTYRKEIEAQGFALRYREAGHRYFRPPPGLARLWQVHVCTVGSKWERDHLLFRDYLRAHSAAADEYGRIKRLAASVHANDRIAYTDAKGPWIERALADAVQWARATGWRP